MSRFNPMLSPFYGMTPEQLQAAITKGQAALVNLMSGGQAETLSYTQGDGARSITYAKANVSALRQTIAEWQQLLNPGLRTRRPMRPYF